MNNAILSHRDAVSVEFYHIEIKFYHIEMLKIINNKRRS